MNKMRNSFTRGILIIEFLNKTEPYIKWDEYEMWQGAVEEGLVCC